ncbi:MAG: hypothetical protein U0792_01390 [Gemmataceae bacterium]
MAKSVSWGGKSLDSLVVLLIVLFCVGVLGALAIQMPPVSNSKIALYFWLASSAILLMILLRVFLLRRTRQTLTATDAGFVHTSSKGTQEIADEDITDLSIGERTEPGFSTVNTIRVIRLEYDLERKTEVLQFELQEDAEDDTFGDALNRAVEKLAHRAVKAIKAGEAFGPRGCTVDGGELVAVKDGETFAVPLLEIKAVEMSGGTVSVWATGRSRPVFTADAGERGVTVLHRVLSKLTAKSKAPPAVPKSTPTFRDAEKLVPVADAMPVAEAVAVPDVVSAAPWKAPRLGAPPVGDEAGLGSLMFSRGSAESTASSKLAAVIFCIAAVVCGIGMTVYGFINQSKPPVGKVLGYAGPVVLLLGIGTAIAQWIRSKLLFQCFTNGVVFTTWQRRTQVMYREIISFTYSCTRMFNGSIYQGTVVEFVFNRSDNRSPLKFAATYYKHDPAFDQLRDHISTVIARHFLKRLSAGEEVRWTKQLTFTPGQLVIKQGEKSGKSTKERVVPFTELGDHEFRNGVFHLLPKGGGNSLVTVEVWERNFFPGYFLFLLLTNSEIRIPGSEADGSEPWGPSKPKPSAPESAGSHFEGWK